MKRDKIQFIIENMLYYNILILLFVVTNLSELLIIDFKVVEIVIIISALFILFFSVFLYDRKEKGKWYIRKKISYSLPIILWFGFIFLLIGIIVFNTLKEAMLRIFIIPLAIILFYSKIYYDFRKQFYKK